MRICAVVRSIGWLACGFIPTQLAKSPEPLEANAISWDGFESGRICRRQPGLRNRGLGSWLKVLLAGQCMKAINGCELLKLPRSLKASRQNYMEVPNGLSPG